MDLDDSQQRVVGEGPGARKIVVAGPGAGKTTTSIALIHEIAGKVDEGQILYVSFSTAAMEAAFRAFGDPAEEDDVAVAAMTLDSLAWQLTDAASGVGDGHAIDFERIVRNAEVLLRTNYSGELDDVVHLIVDEAQDLNTGRRALLCAIVDCLPADAGVTVFGDPLQSIYDFLDEEPDGAGASAWQELLNALGDRSITKIMYLEGEHRARRRGPRKVARLAAEMRSAETIDHGNLVDDVISQLTHLDLIGLADGIANWPGTTAVLAPTNAEAVALFDALSRRGVGCTWRRAGRRRPPVAPWVARLWQSVGGVPVSFGEFQTFASVSPEVDSNWFGLLLDATGSRGSLDWRAVARTCARAADTSIPLFAADRVGAVHVSTIHQAKGLEFDNVAVAGAPSLLRPLGNRRPEIELLFVALTRARDRIVMIDWDAPFTRKITRYGSIYRPHPGRDFPTEVGFYPEYVRSDSRVGGSHTQDILFEHPNGMVEFELMAAGGADHPTYRCRLDGEKVGVTTREFGESLSRILRRDGRSGNWPKLGEVPLDGVESTWSVGTEVEFWLKPRPLGFARLSWRE